MDTRSMPFDGTELLAHLGHEFQLRFMVMGLVGNAEKMFIARPFFFVLHGDENIFRIDLSALEAAHRRIKLIHFRLLKQPRFKLRL